MLQRATARAPRNVAEAGGFADQRSRRCAPDIQFHFLPALVVDHGRTPLDGDGYTLHACCLRPESRGTIRLARPIRCSRR